jgi:hypothetical protein
MRPFWTSVLVLACVCAGRVEAQTVAPPIRTIDVDAGGGLLGGAGLGSRDAELLANAATRTPFRLFTTSSRFDSSPAWHVRGGYTFSRRFAVEGGVVVSHPELTTSISEDVEGAAPLTVAERVDQYFFEGSLIVMIEELGMGARTVPFAAVGAGYLRQLHEGLTVIEHGQVYHAGGGIKHWLMTRDQGFIKAFGVRADARFYLLASGISFSDRPRAHGAFSGGLFMSF